MIMIFGAIMKMISPVVFFLFLFFFNFRFLGCYGGKKAKNSPR